MVIVLIGVIYNFAVQGLHKVKEEKFTLTLMSLKAYLKSFNYQQSVKIICFGACKECILLVDKEQLKEPIDGFLEEAVLFYRYEFSYGYIVTTPETFFNADGVEQDVCFSYSIDKNGAGEQLLIAYKKSFYDFSTYFEKTIEYDSIELAQDAKENQLRDILK